MVKYLCPITWYMIAAFARLRFKQCTRFLIELGIIRSVILLFIFFVVLSSSLTIAALYPSLSCIFLLIVIFSLHTIRGDKTFLKILHLNTFRLYLAEYHFISSPIYFSLLLHNHWIEALWGFAGVSVIPKLNFFMSNENKAFLKLNFLPAEAFEWKSGLRKNYITVLFLYILAIVLFQFPMFAFLVIVIFTFVGITFYNESESRQMVEVFAVSAKQFIRRKGKNQLTIFWIGCLPLILIFLIVNKEYWYVLPAVVIISSIIQLVSIHLKYTFYEPGKTIDNSIFMIVYFFSLFVPFFVPVPLAMLFYYYHKATSNLKNYLPL